MLTGPWIADMVFQLGVTLRSPAAKEYNAGARMHRLVDSQLAWVMDMAAVGQPLQSHVSAELTRVG